MKGKNEIRQVNTTKSEYEKLHVNVLHTASWLNLNMTKLLKPYGISPQQFNILRILQSVHPKPATVKMLTARMVDKMSNASRLVEKLKQKGLVEREPAEEDRRRVNVYLTDKGLALLEKTTHLIEGSINQHLSTIDVAEASRLNELLDRLRS